jgi:ATP-dependent Clp protease ATP-binding subunit ClpA
MGKDTNKIKRPAPAVPVHTAAVQAPSSSDAPNAAIYPLPPDAAGSADEHAQAGRSASTMEPAETDDIGATREHIRQTRDKMSDTIDAIKTKLSPHTLVEEAKDTVREAAAEKLQQAEQAMSVAASTARDVAQITAEAARIKVNEAAQKAQQVGRTAVQNIKKRPLMAALAGIGVAWLLIAINKRCHVSRLACRQ